MAAGQEGAEANRDGVEAAVTKRLQRAALLGHHIGAIAIRTPAVAPQQRLQRALSPNDEAELDGWILEVGLPIQPKDVPEVKASADSLAEAKREAISRAVAFKVDQYLKLPRGKKHAAEFGKDTQGKQMARSVPSALASLAEELFDSYAKASHHFVLLGNSPALLAPELRRAKAEYSQLPLGGLSDPGILKKVFSLIGSKKVEEGGPDQAQPENQRKAYQALIQVAPVLQEYLATYLKSLQSEKPLVLVDYTQSGVSVVAAADMLHFVSSEILNIEREVKLFTYSTKLPDKSSLLTAQSDYEAVAAEPVGEAEKTFVDLEDGKVLKERMLLYATKSLKLDKLLEKKNADFMTLWNELYIPELEARLFELL